MCFTGVARGGKGSSLPQRGAVPLEPDLGAVHAPVGSEGEYSGCTRRSPEKSRVHQLQPTPAAEKYPGRNSHKQQRQQHCIQHAYFRGEGSKKMCDPIFNINLTYKHF